MPPSSAPVVLQSWVHVGSENHLLNLRKNSRSLARGNQTITIHITMRTFQGVYQQRPVPQRPNVCPQPVRPSKNARSCLQPATCSIARSRPRTRFAPAPKKKQLWRRSARRSPPFFMTWVTFKGNESVRKAMEKKNT